MDPDLLHQAFLNLLLNAIQAMPGGGRLTVSTQAGPQGRGGEIRFADTGDGIEPESLEEDPQPLFHHQGEGQRPGSAHRQEHHRDPSGQPEDRQRRVGQGTMVTITLPELALQKVS